MTKSIWPVLGSVVMIALSSCANLGGGEKKENEKEEKHSISFFQQEPNYAKASDLNVELGYSYLKKGQMTRAKGKFIHALDLQDKSPKANVGMAYYYRVVGEQKLAEAYYLKAIKYEDGSKGEYYSFYGDFLCEVGRYAEGESMLKKAISDHKYHDVAISYQKLGQCMDTAGQSEKSESYYKSALRHDPYLPTAAFELARISFSKGAYESSWKYLSQLKDNHGLDAKGLVLGINLAKEIGDYDSVANYELMLRSKFRDTFEYREYLGSKTKETKRL